MISEHAITAEMERTGVGRMQAYRMCQAREQLRRDNGQFRQRNRLSADALIDIMEARARCPECRAKAEASYRIAMASMDRARDAGWERARRLIEADAARMKGEG